jgi:hypothetical protein
VVIESETVRQLYQWKKEFAYAKWCKSLPIPRYGKWILQWCKFVEHRLDTKTTFMCII